MKKKGIPEIPLEFYKLVRYEGEAVQVSVHGLFFEANSIQAYILLGGRLRDVVGASHLIDSLCQDTLERTLEVLGLQRRCHFVRRAAGSFYALFESGAEDNLQHATSLAAAWAAVVREVCPGLTFNVSVAQGGNAFMCVRNGTAALGQSRALPTNPLPLANPLVERSPRTGLAAVAYSSIRGTREMVDAAVAARRVGYSGTRNDSLSIRLLGGMEPGPFNKSWTFPRTLERDADDPSEGSSQFPFVGGAVPYIAVIHADANGLGQMLIRLIDRADQLDSKGHVDAARSYRQLLPDISTAIASSMERSVQSAIAAVLIPEATRAGTGTLAARPLVLAGDDVTIIVRADLALSFTRHLLEQFESISADLLGKLAKKPEYSGYAADLPTGLTACAGLQFVKSSYPFSQALHLSEDLCARAKSAAKARGAEFTCSAVSFDRLTESLEDSGSDSDRVPAYGVGARASGLPPLRELQQLVSTVGAIPRGPLRRLLNTSQQSAAEARQDLARWRAVMLDNSPQHLSSVDHLMQQLSASAGHPSESTFCVGRHSVLPDIADLLSVQSNELSGEPA